MQSKNKVLHIIIFLFCSTHLFTQVDIKKDLNVNWNTYAHHTQSELYAKVNQIFDTLKINRNFSLKEVLDAFKLSDQYQGISLDGIIQQVDWNEIASKMDWNQLFQSMDFNEMVNYFCEQASANEIKTPSPNDTPQTPISDNPNDAVKPEQPIKFEIPDSIGNTQVFNPEDYMKCFNGILENPMKIMPAINMPCLLQMMQNNPLDSAGNTGFSIFDLTNTVQGQGNLPDTEAICPFMDCMDMNVFLKEVDWNCVIGSMDFSQIMQHWKMDDFIKQFGSVPMNQSQDFTEQQLQKNPFFKVFSQNINMDSFVNNVKFAFEDFFPADKLIALNQNFSTSIFDKNIPFEATANNLRSQVRFFSSFLLNEYGDSQELRNFIVYFFFQIETLNSTLSFDFQGIIDKQRIAKDIILEAYQNNTFQELIQDVQFFSDIFNKKFESRLLAKDFQLYSHISSELGQHTESLNFAKAALKLKEDFLGTTGTDIPIAPYFQFSFSLNERERLMQKYDISISLVKLLKKDLLEGEEIHPKKVRRLLKVNEAATAIEYYLVIKDLLLEKSSTFTDTPGFESPNELATKLFELMALKKLYANIALILEDTVDTNKSKLAFYKNAAASLDKFQAEQDLAIAYNNLGTIYFVMQDYENALKYLRTSMDLLKKVGNLDYVNTGISGFGEIGEESQNKLPAFIGIINNMAHTYSLTGEIDKLISFLNQEIDYLKDLANKEQQAPNKKAEININRDLFAIYNLLGQAYLQKKDLINAEKYLRKSETAIQGNQKPYWQFLVHTNLGNFHRASNQLDSALFHFQKAKTNAALANSQYGIAATNVQIGKIYQRKGQRDLAFQHYDSAEAIARPVCSFDVLFGIYNNKGHQFKKEQQFTKALEVFDDAIQLVEDSLLVNLQGASARQLTLSKGFEAYKGAIECALQLENQDLVFRYIQQSKSRILNETLSNAYLQSDQIPENLKYKRNDLLVNIRLTNDLTVRDSLLRNFEILEADIRASNPKIMEALTISFATLTQVQKELQPHQAFIEYFVGNTVQAIVITSNEVVVYQLKSSKDILNNLKLFQGLKDSLENHFKNIDIRENLFSEMANLSSELHQQLIEPLSPTLSTKGISDLLISPDNALYYLPFEILVSKASEDFWMDNQYLSDKYRINYFQSATTFLQNQTKISEKNASKELLIFTKRRFGEYSDYQFNPLSGNTRFIEKQFSKVDVLKDAQVDLDTLKQLNLGNYQHLYFSTHGIFNDEQPELSFLALNKRLFTLDALNLNLKNCESVALSACQTGQGKFKRGAGISGFTNALMRAGAASVIVSLWSVEEKATAALFNSYYKHLAKGVTPQQALFLAKEALKNGDYKHPFYWASFVIFGGHSNPKN